MSQVNSEAPLITIEPKLIGPDDTRVTIYADNDGSGGIRWSHKNEDHDNGGKLKLGKDKNYKVTFNLVDRTSPSRKIRFDASEPIFVKQGSGGSCPRALDSDQILVDSCDARKLIAIDWNYGVPCELHYQLNFVDEAGGPIPPYDPIIENGGGGTKPTIALINS
jgi:hypothetical protein